MAPAVLVALASVNPPVTDLAPDLDDSAGLVVLVARAVVEFVRGLQQVAEDVVDMVVVTPL